MFDSVLNTALLIFDKPNPADQFESNASIKFLEKRARFLLL